MTARADTSVDRRRRLVLGTADLRDDGVTPLLLDKFVAAGGRAIDLANVYADGESERAVGRWLAASGAEPTLYVKGCHPPYCSSTLVRAEVDKTRSLLGVDVIDAFLLHRDDPATPVGAFADALLGEVERGSITAFGVSNWTLRRFDELARALGSERAKLVAFSNHFSLATMVTPPWPDCLAMGKPELDALGESGTLVLAWASLAAGYFAGRDSPSWDTPANARRRRRAVELAADRGTTATAVALAYTLHQPHNLLPVIGTTSERHLEELLGAADLELTPDELAALEA